MGKIEFQVPGEKEAVEFYVLEQTTIGGISYLLVTTEEEGDSDALILKDVSTKEDTESIYEIVESDEELDAISKVFEEVLDDIDFIQ